MLLVCANYDKDIRRTLKDQLPQGKKQSYTKQCRVIRISVIFSLVYCLSLLLKRGTHFYSLFKYLLILILIGMLG